ncbi:MAG: translation initiation factor IF-2, partial [Candidatus Omnitrophica bacterium]|nr:translation initiation factor IF-2 [Candidatus Omnitrophota bacterium]
LGHVDHGKTSLLDAFRQTYVADKEAGKITQHIGAYGVDIAGKGHVTFLDTPGHAAFTAMRARGANVTDVVVLVVAADDGIMPQTVEAIDHARAAGVPILVAINKIDLPNANAMRVKKELQKMDLMPEEWGGKTICVEVSAKTGKGIPELLEMLLLESEILELKANPNRSAEGTVLESKLTKSHGTVVTVLVQRGTLRIGDIVVCGAFYGRVRALRNDKGKNVKEAGPSYAVEVLGLSGLPDAGETFQVLEDEKQARKVAEKRQLELREKAMRGALNQHITLEGLYSQLKQGGLKDLKIILKADMQGSIEALSELLSKLSTDKIHLSIIHAGIGGINESDIMLAAASDAVVFGFHVQADGNAESLAEKEGVEVRFYNIIYEVVEEVRKAMEGLLEPTNKEVIQGRAEIRQVFRSSKAGNIGGAIVVHGRVSRQHRVRLIRNKIVIFDGKLASLRRFKDDVKEVQEGFECGIALEGHNDIQERDIVEAYKIEKVAAKL